MRVDCVPGLREFVRRQLSPERFGHCERTEETARRLCVHFGLSGAGDGCENSAVFCCCVAGLCHDMARELPEDEILSYAEKYSPLTEWEAQSPVLAHGKAAAWILSDRFGIDSPQVLEAVRTHTVAEPGMSMPGKAVFIADFIEPGRRYIEKDFLARFGYLSMDGMMLLVLERTLRYLKDKGRAVASPSLRLYKELAGKEFGAEDITTEFSVEGEKGGTR